MAKYSLQDLFPSPSELQVGGCYMDSTRNADEGKIAHPKMLKYFQKVRTIEMQVTAERNKAQLLLLTPQQGYKVQKDASTTNYYL